MSEPTPTTRVERYARGVLRWRWLVMIATVLVLMPVAAGMKNIAFDNNYRAFFGRTNPQLEAFEKLQNVYTKDDNVFIVVEPEGGNVFNPETMAAIEWLTAEAWKLPHTLRVDALTNFQHTRATEDDLVVEDLIAGAGQMSPADLAARRAIALDEPLLAGRLLVEDSRMTGVSATQQFPGADITEVPETAAAARRLAAEFERRFPGHRTYVTGTTMLNAAFAEAGVSDLRRLIPLVYLGMLVVMFLLLRSVSGTVATLAVIGMSTIAGMGFAGWAGIKLTPPSATAPTMILTLAIADSIHILVTMLREMAGGRSKHDAIVESMRVNMQPVFLTSLTTVIGFLSMNFSDAPPFRHLGNITAVGVAAAFVLSVTFLPAFISLLPVRVRARADRSSGFMERLADGIIARRRPVLFASAAVVLLFSALIPRNDLNDQFVEYFDKRIQFRVDTDYVTDNLTGLYRIEYSIGAGGSGAISNPEYLATLDRFAAWFRDHPQVTHVNSFSDVMKRLNKNLHADDPAYYAIPANRELAAQYLLLYEMSLPFGLDLNNQIDVDKSATRFIVTLDGVTSNEIQQIAIEGEEWLATHGGGTMDALGSGPSVMFSYIAARNIRSMLTGTGLAIVLIALTLIVALRSVRYGLLSLVPNVVPAILGFGLWGVLVGQIGLSLSVVSAMTLGIVVDDSVHFISKYLRARREHGYSDADAVRYAFSSVGWALVVTTAILTAGFLVMSLSAFQLNAGMGQLTAIVIVFALIADFTLLPAILLRGAKQESESNATEVFRHVISTSEAA